MNTKWIQKFRKNINWFCIYTILFIQNFWTKKLGTNLMYTNALLLPIYYNAFILDIDLAFYTLIKNCTKNSELHIFIFRAIFDLSNKITLLILLWMYALYVKKKTKIENVSKGQNCSNSAWLSSTQLNLAWLGSTQINLAWLGSARP